MAIKARPGDQLELKVTSEKPGTVELADLGPAEDVGPEQPAFFDVLLESEGTYPVPDHQRPSAKSPRSKSIHGPRRATPPAKLISLITAFSIPSRSANSLLPPALPGDPSWP